MRVVSGSCKGRMLKSVAGKQTRPTTDKVKEAIFNIIGPYFAGGTALDLFAGSGALGIEALSRGVERVLFVDRDMKAFQTVKENVNRCGLEEKTEIYRNDAVRALKAIVKREIYFDYIFIDPPYKKQKIIQLLEIIDEETLLNDDGVIVCEHEASIQLPSQIGDLHCIRHEVYGITAISLYMKGLVV